MGLLVDGDEGPSEIDVIIEAASWVWFIEAKYRSDISTGTKVRPDRDQILRNLDVGTHYAGIRRFFFSLLVSNENRTPVGLQKLNEYQDIETVRSKLSAHRDDKLMNLQGIGLLTWRDMGNVLQHAYERAERHDERIYAKRALDWMQEKKLTLGEE